MMVRRWWTEARRRRTESRASKPLVEAFDVSTDESLELLHKLSRDLGKGLSSSKYDPEIRKMKDDLSKYRRHVNRYYLKTINDFGEPIAPTQFAEMPAS